MQEHLNIAEKTQYQKKALFYKFFTLQMRQKGSTLAQFLIPIFGLVIMMFAREATMQNTDLLTNQDVILPVPNFYN